MKLKRNGYSKKHGVVWIQYRNCFDTAITHVSDIKTWRSAISNLYKFGELTSEGLKDLVVFLRRSIKEREAK